MIGKMYIKLVVLTSAVSLVLCFINNFLKTEQNICLFLFLLTFNKDYNIQKKVVLRLHLVIAVFMVADWFWIVYHSLFFLEFRRIYFFYYTTDYFWFVLFNTFVLFIAKAFIIYWLCKYSSSESSPANARARPRPDRLEDAQAPRHFLRNRLQPLRRAARGGHPQLPENQLSEPDPRQRRPAPAHSKPH